MVRHAHPCLCVFDIDRTLTGKSCPNDHRVAAECPAWHTCKGNFKHIDGVVDTAYGSGALMESKLFQNFEATFCARNCYLGILTAGDASGAPSSAEANLIYTKLRSMPHGTALPTENANAWREAKHAFPGWAPMIINSADGHKQEHMYAIVQWYKENHGLAFEQSRTWFFDDRETNIVAFAGTGYNAKQVSCASRDAVNSIGLCGATHDEVSEEFFGVRLCSTPRNMCVNKEREVVPCPMLSPSLPVMPPPSPPPPSPGPAIPPPTPLLPPWLPLGSPQPPAVSPSLAPCGPCSIPPPSWPVPRPPPSLPPAPCSSPPPQPPTPSLTFSLTLTTGTAWLQRMLIENPGVVGIIGCCMLFGAVNSVWVMDKKRRRSSWSRTAHYALNAQTKLSEGRKRKDSLMRSSPDRLQEMDALEPLTSWEAAGCERPSCA